MTKLQKNVECFYFTEWSRETGAIAFRRVTLQSWGKVQGTASYCENGKMTEARLYVRHDAARLVPVADCADPRAEALRRSVEFIARERAHFEGIINGTTYQYAYATSKNGATAGVRAYAEAIDAGYANICAQTPSAVDCDNAAEMDAAMAAYRARKG